MDKINRDFISEFEHKEYTTDNLVRIINIIREVDNFLVSYNLDYTKYKDNHKKNFPFPNERESYMNELKYVCKKLHLNYLDVLKEYNIIDYELNL